MVGPYRMISLVFFFGSKPKLNKENSGDLVEIVPWLLLALNVLGAGLMVRWGLPREIPLVGREDGDPVFGYLGLLMFVTSIAVRVALTVTG